MRKRHLIGLAMSVLLTACATYEMTSVFDPAEAAFASRRGSGVVEGQSFLRQRGGGVVTCAGFPVALLPSTTYTNELFTRSFGSPSGGVAGPFAPSPTGEADPRLKQFVRNAQCDAGGNFRFAGVPPGSYWALSQVTWTVGNSILPEGGLIARKVDIRGGERVQVLLTH